MGSCERSLSMPHHTTRRSAKTRRLVSWWLRVEGGCCSTRLREPPSPPPVLLTGSPWQCERFEGTRALRTPHTHAFLKRTVRFPLVYIYTLLWYSEWHPLSPLTC